MVPGDWFTHVVSNLKNVDVLIVLLSQVSNRKEWINYETGVVEGAAKHHDQRGFAKNILPVVIRGLSKNEVSGPIRHYQVSDTHNLDDLNWVLDQTARLVGKVRQETDLEQFIQQVTDIEKSMVGSASNQSEETEDEKLEWELLAGFTEPSREGLILRPAAGTLEWKAAERLVSKGRLERLPNSMGYAIPGQKFKLKGM